MTKLTKQQLALRTKWTTALRSGKYRQAQNRLRKDDAFCCLGVLCDIVGAPTSGVYPSEETTALVGIGNNEAAGGRPVGGYLWEMNDNFGDDFATIADAIDLDTLMRQDGCL